MAKKRLTAKSRKRRVTFKETLLSIAVIAAVILFAELIISTQQSDPQAAMASASPSPATASAPAQTLSSTSAPQSLTSGGFPTVGDSLPFTVLMLDVGQGDAILILSDGHAALIDSGDSYMKDELMAYLSRAGVTHLDAVIGTHAHSDHMANLDSVLLEISSDAFYARASEGSWVYDDAFRAAASRSVKVKHPDAGESIMIGEVELTFLWPNKGEEITDINDTSYVILAKAEGASVLLTGDAESFTERALQKAGLLEDVDVLKCAHHGSNTSTKQFFVDIVKPEYALVSVGEDNDYGHPSDFVMTRLEKEGARIYRTDEDGTVVVNIIDGTIESWCVK